MTTLGLSASPDSGATAAVRSSLTAAASILVVVLLAASMSVDVVRAGFGVKGDEATYVALALSAAYDRDLTYQRRDLERFWGLYRAGPEGIFLKRGKQWDVERQAAAPYVRVSRPPDRRGDRLYFGKAFIYPLVAAPFVWLLGLNGFLVFHTLLLVGVLVCGYQFLAAQSKPIAAAAFTLAFIGATVVPVYGVLLTSDIFNFSLVFLAYFLWLYKEVAPPNGVRFLRSFGSDVAAAILLGVVTFSKPTHLLLIGPIVLLFWWRRRISPGLVIACVFALSTGVLWGANAIVTGEVNYQGGDRKTFYGRFPFDAPDSTWDRMGLVSATNDADTANVLNPSSFVNRFSLNVKYFFLGRHSGFVPYFFPGVVALCFWLASRERFRPWRLLTFLGLAASTVGLLVVAPDTWNGGGGPPGNRYFLSLYPVLFFVTPPLLSMTAPMLAWAIGALFTAHMVLNPFVTMKYTYLMFERGAARRLPVELTMANDLPVALSSEPLRARIHYRDDPMMLLYFLDQNASPPEPPGMWVMGGRRADIIVRTDDPLDHLAISAESPIQTTLTVSLGAAPVVLTMAPGQIVNFNVPARGVRALYGYAYLMSAQSSNGFVPHLQDPNSTDSRNLGALLRFQAIPVRPQP